MHVSISSAEIDALGSTVLELSLTNSQDVGGFQFQIVDWPNQGVFTDTQVTDRTSTFMLSFNEQPDGSMILLGFSLQGDVISQGTGPILTLTYESTGIYSSEIQLSILEENSILSDPLGSPLPFTFTPGTITVNGETPPPITAPENLTATGGFGEIDLTWDDTNTTEVIGYHIFNDGNLIGSSTTTNYTETGLQQGSEYCYTVTAYDAGDDGEFGTDDDRESNDANSISFDPDTGAPVLVSVGAECSTSCSPTGEGGNVVEHSAPTETSTGAPVSGSKLILLASLLSRSSSVPNSPSSPAFTLVTV
jgi:hypothetical protein